MDKKQVEEIYNKTFAGLSLFYRDAELPDGLISKYQKGQILNERGFTDMSYKGGGLTTNCRYLIASSNGRDVSVLDPNSEKFGHIMLKSNAFFKVLDVYKLKNKTQVFLLDIPSEAIDFFSETTSNIEDQIIEKAREHLDLKIDEAPVPELQTKEWRERTDFPLGMNNKGEFFYQKEESKQENLKPKKPRWKFW